jgi:predicted RNA-binding Zn ribbon-like protein
MAAIPLPLASGAADHVSLALVNSLVTLPNGHLADELGSPEEATTWLIAHGLAPEETALQAYCQTQLTALRGDLRALFTAHVEGAPPSAETLENINRALTKVPNAALLCHRPGVGLYRTLKHPVTEVVEHAMARIAEDAAALLTGERSQQVARCAAMPCDRFILRTHGRRHWCCTRCGDRVRAARAYARKQSRYSTDEPTIGAPDS